jgi:hypothetical protein
MALKNLAPPLLDETSAGFIESGVTIYASSRTDQNIPVMGRVAGCRVSADRRTVTLLFTSACVPELLDGISKSARIAVVFSQPGTSQTIQLKGDDATLISPQKGDVALVEQHCETFVAEVCPLGYSEPLLRAFMWFDPADLRAVRFTPQEAFVQTPGPRAGEPLKGGVRADAG